MPRSLLSFLFTASLIAAPPLEQRFAQIPAGYPVRIQLHNGAKFEAQFRGLQTGEVTLITLEQNTLSDRTIPLAAIKSVKKLEPSSRRSRGGEAFGKVALVMFVFSAILSPFIGG